MHGILSFINKKCMINYHVCFKIPFFHFKYEGRHGRDCDRGSWIYNYMCNQCLSPLKCECEPRSWRDVLDTTLCDEVCQ